jgi:hypothetical protein
MCIRYRTEKIRHTLDISQEITDSVRPGDRLSGRENSGLINNNKLVAIQAVSGDGYLMYIRAAL